MIAYSSLLANYAALSNIEFRRKSRNVVFSALLRAFL